MFLKIKRIHFTGIGGIGMSGLAELLKNMGFEVTGSDISVNSQVERLQSMGVPVTVPHDPRCVEPCDLVVTSSAIPADNPEVEAAHARHIPVIPRAEMLAELMKMKYGIAIAGSHGKTTTASMTGMILTEAGMDPTLVIGGVLKNMGSNTKMGQGHFLVAEADESDGTFLMLSPTIAVVTSIDREHLDHYSGLDEIKRDFLAFINKVPFYGTAVISMDDDNLLSLMPNIRRNVITYGLTSQADVTARNITREGLTSHFDVQAGGRDLGRFSLSMPGRHMVSNALAAIAASLELSIDPDTIRRSLASFKGVKRRFEMKGEAGGVEVYDDYAHHPTEIRATLEMVREHIGRPVTVLFQPHRYSRTRDLMEDFARAFFNADRVLVTNIYGASEKPIEGVSGERLVELMRLYGHKGVQFCSNPETGAFMAADESAPGNVIITMGAGTVTSYGDTIVSRIATRSRFFIPASGRESNS